MIAQETGVKPELVEGGRSEFTIWVGERQVADKSLKGFPSDETVILPCARRLVRIPTPVRSLERWRHRRRARGTPGRIVLGGPREVQTDAPRAGPPGPPRFRLRLRRPNFRSLRSGFHTDAAASSDLVVPATASPLRGLCSTLGFLSLYPPCSPCLRGEISAPPWRVSSVAFSSPCSPCLRRIPSVAADLSGGWSGPTSSTTTARPIRRTGPTSTASCATTRRSGISRRTRPAAAVFSSSRHAASACATRAS